MYGQDFMITWQAKKAYVTHLLIQSEEKPSLIHQTTCILGIDWLTFVLDRKGFVIRNHYNDAVAILLALILHKCNKTSLLTRTLVSTTAWIVLLLSFIFLRPGDSHATCQLISMLWQTAMYIQALLIYAHEYYLYILSPAVA